MLSAAARQRTVRTQWLIGGGASPRWLPRTPRSRGMLGSESQGARGFASRRSPNKSSEDQSMTPAEAPEAALADTERRQVNILFFHLVDSVGLSTRLDPDEI